MRKSLAFILALSLLSTVLFAFCSCGDNEKEGNVDETTQATQSTQATYTMYNEGGDNIIDDPFVIDETDAVSETEADE